MKYTFGEIVWSKPIHWMVWNENVCLNETFEIVGFEIKIMSLWDKRNLK